MPKQDMTFTFLELNIEEEDAVLPIQLTYLKKLSKCFKVLVHYSLITFYFRFIGTSSEEVAI